MGKDAEVPWMRLCHAGWGHLHGVGISPGRAPQHAAHVAGQAPLRGGDHGKGFNRMVEPPAFQGGLALSESDHVMFS